VEEKIPRFVKNPRFLQCTIITPFGLEDFIFIEIISCYIHIKLIKLVEVGPPGIVILKDVLKKFPKILII